MPKAGFETMLTGGHPNSLGNTVKVVNQVLKNRSKLKELFECWFSEDEVVRLRVSNAMKRVCKEKQAWLVPLTDRLIKEIAKINQASTQWTIAQLFDELKGDMTSEQKSAALRIMKKNLEKSEDWIVLNTTMQVLFDWSSDNSRLRTWLKPRLARLAKDPRKSVSNRAAKLAAKINRT